MKHAERDIGVHILGIGGQAIPMRSKLLIPIIRRIYRSEFCKEERIRKGVRKILYIYIERANKIEGTFYPHEKN